MKLRNKKTGEIVEPFGIICVNGRNFVQFDDEKGIFKFEAHSLADLNAEWEDYEEPKDSIDYIGLKMEDYNGTTVEIQYQTKEEAEKAVEKLKAWKRLKDKGFEFKGINTDTGNIKTGLSKGVSLDECEEFYEDMKLLFGGEV